MRRNLPSVVGRARTNPRGLIATRTSRSLDWKELMDGFMWKTLFTLPYFSATLALQLVNTGLNVLNQFRTDPTPEQLDAIRRSLSMMTMGMEGQTTILNNIGNILTWTYLQTEVQTRIMLGQTQQLNTISDQMQSMTSILQGIANDIHTFTRPSVYNQIMDIGSLFIDAAAVAQIKRLADSAEKMTSHLAGIEQNLRSVNYRGDYFPGHIHSWIRTMIESYVSDPVSHYFVVFNPSTTWHPKFEDIRRTTPLGPQFLGYKHNLDELCAFLVEEVRPRLGPKPVLHILMPMVKQLAITESLTFPAKMRPFQVEGQLGEDGAPFVYLCTPLDQDRECLRHIGSLNPRDRWVLLARVGVCLPFLAQYLSTELEPTYWESPTFAIPTFSSLLVADTAYVPCAPIPPRTLGRPRPAEMVH